MHLLFKSTVILPLLAFSLAAATLSDSEFSPEEHYRRAVRLHLQRRLDEASHEYARVLALEPSRSPMSEEWAIIRRFAPRLMITPDEPFSLKDAAAILHPTRRLIAYHLFWEDDIDFPDDNDPCDHEVVWIRYNADGSDIEAVWTYFHDRILPGAEDALEEARANHLRARVHVQWGKHGSMPVGWERMRLANRRGDLEHGSTDEGSMSLLDYNRDTWNRLSQTGRRSRTHAIARRLGWPQTYGGSFEAITNFSREIDLLEPLSRQKLVAVSRWNNAVIDQEFLTYNFRPKTEWPEASGGAGSPISLSKPILPGQTPLDSFQLPPKSVLGNAAPRFPNVWFYLDVSLADSHEEAVMLVTREMRGAMRFRERLTHSEGCDFEVRVEHLQEWEDRAHRSLQHSHAFHMRYYHSALSRAGLDRVTLQTLDGPRTFFRFAASAHYEVEHTNPNHADVEICPHCGRTGEYAGIEGNLVEKVHDPLGLELLFDGTIRRRILPFEDDPPRPFGGLGLLSSRYRIERQVYEPTRADQNTLRIGIAVIAPYHTLKN